MSISRRRFLRETSLLSTAAVLRLSSSTQAQQASPPPGTPTYQTLIPPKLPTLREAGASRNLLTGCAVNTRALAADPQYALLVRQQADIVVAEDAMKFGPLRPTPDTFFFDEADALFTFAEAAGMKVRGHNFAWHRQLPPWFSGTVTPQNAEAVLVRHIETVAGRYAGRVQSWDVVNEAIHIPDGRPGGLRFAPWYQLLGPGYLDLAFRTAKRADPSALLCYNDYGLEGETPEEAAKRAAILTLLRGLLDRQVPVEAVGIQSHITAGPEHLAGPGLQRFMTAVQGMGLKLMITELDVSDRLLPAAPAPRDAAIADAYRHYLDLTLANPDVIALLTWGLTDRYTWLNGADVGRRDHLPARCLPFDANLRPVPAYCAAVEAIQRIRPRP